MLRERSATETAASAPRCSILGAFKRDSPAEQHGRLTQCGHRRRPNTQVPDGSGLWGRFELRELVGRGSFGEVYRAWDPDLQREVGLKLLVPRPSQGECVRGILREARALAAVRHPNILPVYGVDRHEGGSDSGRISCTVKRWRHWCANRGRRLSRGGADRAGRLQGR